MKTRVVASLLLVACASQFGNGLLKAAEILRREYEESSSVPVGVARAAMFISIGNRVGEEYSIGHRIFDDAFLSVADIGTTLHLVAGDRGFDAFAAHITNGVDEFLWTGVHWPSPLPDSIAAGGNPESIRLFGPDPPTGATDLSGYIIEGISLRLDRMRFYEIFAAPNVIDASFTVTFEGHPIPEPQTALLALSAVLLITISRFVTKAR